jgi:hypothetical protein
VVALRNYRTEHHFIFVMHGFATSGQAQFPGANQQAKVSSSAIAKAMNFRMLRGLKKVHEKKYIQSGSGTDRKLMQQC